MVINWEEVVRKIRYLFVKLLLFLLFLFSIFWLLYKIYHLTHSEKGGGERLERILFIL